MTVVCLPFCCSYATLLVLYVPDITKGVLEAQDVHRDAYGRYIKFETERRAALEAIRKKEAEEKAKREAEEEEDF